MKKTPEERSRLLDDAFAYLQKAKAARQAYVAKVDDAIREYGDGNGVLISGVYRDHFPEWFKIELRTIARGIGTYSDLSHASWKSAGKRSSTWRRYAESYRVDGCRY